MFIRKRLTYANVAATLALVFSMSGGALAASHYLITSTKQISPKVIKKLKGKAGPAGKTGATGKEGPAGKEGLAGKEGKEGKEGPPGKAGTALAWAFMSREATLEDTHNFSPTYTNPETGVYCLTPTGGVSPSTSPIAMVTVEWGFSSGSELSAYPWGNAGDCSPGQYEVLTFEPAGTRSNSVAFYIEIPA